MALDVQVAEAGQTCEQLAWDGCPVVVRPALVFRESADAKIANTLEEHLGQDLSALVRAGLWPGELKTLKSRTF